ncbi:g166 [Coccomyxa elongata]
MQRRGPVAALFVAAQCLSFCLLFAEADALGSSGTSDQGSLSNNELIQLLQDIPVTMRNTDTVACRLPVVWKDELLTNCKEATKISPIPWCFTADYNKRRACTAEEGPTRPLSWFLAAQMGTDGKPGSLCSISGGSVAGYNMTACTDGLLCAPFKSGKLFGTGVGFCNLTAPGQSYEVALDTRPQFMLSGQTPVLTPAAVAKTVSDDNAGSIVGAINGLQDVKVASRVTTQGDACQLPLVYKGALVTDCVDVAGQSSCFTGSLDTPTPCKPLAAGQAAQTQALADMLAEGTSPAGSHGSLCKLYADAGAKIGAVNITACDQGLACTPLQVAPLVGSGFGYCSQAAGNTTGAVDAALPPSAGGVASLSAYNVIPRTTIIDEKCRLPVVYGDSLLLDCVPLSAGSAVPECFVEGLAVVDECKPATEPPATLMSFAGADTIGDGKDGSLCFTSNSTGSACDGDMACMPLTGPLSGSGMGYCTQTQKAPGHDAAKEYYVAKRSTVSGTPCRLPIIAGGNLLLDCTKSNGKELCFPEGSDTPAECAPESQPVTAALSSLMNAGQAMDGKRGSMCTDTDRFRGKKVGCDAPLACEAMIGPLLHSGYGYCTDLNIGKFGMTGAMRASKVAQRRTANGVPCRLPLMYNGQLQMDCTKSADGKTEQCFVVGLAAPQTCDPKPFGDPIKLPILMASGQAGDGAKGSICALPRNASGPSDCNTPLWCKPSDVPPLHGSGYGSCTDETYVPPAMPVAVAQPQAAALAPASPLDGFEVAERTTRAGATCRLPLIYKGNLILDCRDFNNSGTEQCFTMGTSEPQPCKPPASGAYYPPLTEALATGNVIDGNEGSLCVLNTGYSAHRTAHAAKSPYIPASAGGGACNLGLNCLSLRGPLDGSGYGYCALTVDGQMPVRTGNVAGGLVGVRVAERRTIEGKQCRLPVVYQGELIRDCRSLDGSSQSQCFVDGLRAVQDCADTRNYPTELAPVLLAAGRGADGDDGSLCTTVLSSATPATDKVLPCKAPLACLPLQAGGDAGSGYGYCTELGQQAQQQGAAAITVSNRTSDSGVPCRLPVVYKGELLTGCVPVNGGDKCFTGDFAAGPSTCAKAVGGYNLTSFANLLASGRADDGREGSLCDPKASQSGVLGCNSGLLCVPMSKGLLASAKFGYCAGGEEAKKALAAMGSAAPVIHKQAECGTACIAGAAVGGALLAALLVSGAWWFSVRRTRAKRKSMFSKFDDAEFADVAAAFGEDAAKPKPKAVSIAPARSDGLGTQPVHKSALPVPSNRPPRPSATRASPPAAQPQPAGKRVLASGGGSGESPASLIGPNLSALAASPQASLTDSSPFAQTLERKSSAASSRTDKSEEIPAAAAGRGGARSRQGVSVGQSADVEDVVGPSGDSGSSTRSNAALMKKD